MGGALSDSRLNRAAEYWVDGFALALSKARFEPWFWFWFFFTAAVVAERSPSGAVAPGATGAEVGRKKQVSTVLVLS